MKNASQEPIKILSHKDNPQCICGEKNFFTISCQATDGKIFCQLPDGEETQIATRKIEGMVYCENILAITVCLSCNRLQGFNSKNLSTKIIR